MKAGVKKTVSRGRGRPALSFLEAVKAMVDDPVINAVRDEAGGAGVWLVGGVLRDMALGRVAAKDYDFVAVRDVGGLSERLAMRLGGRAFLLDKKSLSYRVAVKKTGLTLDFSPVKEGDIAGDLKARDFTVDAIGVELDTLGSERPHVLDPCGGTKDAEKKILRACGPGAFSDDPLRCLRALRISQQCGLRTEAGTARLIKESAPLLKRTSAERVRDELILIFGHGKTAASVESLYKLGIIGAILPKISGWADIGGYDLLTHSLRTCAESERLLCNLEETFPGYGDRMQKHFDGSIGVVKRGAVLKLAAFLHDAGKPLAISREEGRLRFIGHDRLGALLVKETLTRLKFSRRLTNTVSHIVKNHHRTFMLSDLKEISLRARGHFFRAAGGEAGLDVLCLALSDARATRGGEDERLLEVVREMVSFYFGTFIKRRPRPVLNGDEIMRIFKVGQGRIVGEIMAFISGAIEAGRIRDRKGAVSAVRAWLDARGGK